MNRLIKELLKEAHDFGYGHAKSNLGWDQDKCWLEFQKQNNIPLVTIDEIRDETARKAIQLREQGHSLREIASILGYSHPQSVSHCINFYDKRLRKKKNKQ
jgi:Tfp pilus assembly ATPase PilU